MRQKDFTQIANKVTKSGNTITNTEYRLYCTLKSYDYQKGFSYPGREKLARDMGMSVATIDRAKKGLIEKGYINKKRRGQGLTNLYYFLPVPDNSKLSGLDDLQVSGKLDLGNNTLNNYLKTSLPSKETTFGEKPQPLPVTQPSTKPQPEVVFRSNLKSIKESLDSWLDRYPDSELDEGTISRNTDAAVKGIVYYIRKYKIYCKVDHPFYKPQQLRDCMEGFLDGIWQVEHCGIPLSLDEIVTKVIDRWFETTAIDSNNMRLSVFVGKYSLVFSRALESVMADYGLEWRRDDVDS